MREEAAQNLRDSERRVDLQITKIRELDRAGRLSDARRARETLAVITETRDALRLHLKVAEKVVVTQARWASLRRILLPPPREG